MLNLLKDCQLFISNCISIEDDDDIKNWDDSFYLHYKQNHQFHQHNHQHNDQHNHHAYHLMLNLLKDCQLLSPDDVHDPWDQYLNIHHHQIIKAINTTIIIMMMMMMII